MDVIKKLQRTLIFFLLDPNPKDRAKSMIQEFDAKFTNMSQVVANKVQVRANAQIFDIIFAQKKERQQVKITIVN